MKFLKTILVACFISLLWLTGIASAAPQQITAEGEYRIGDRDTREDAKQAALAEAKRKIAEQAGVVVESYTEVNTFQVSQDQIKIFAKASMRVKSERVEFTENRMTCRAYVTAVIDVDSIMEKLGGIAKKTEPAPPESVSSEPARPTAIKPPPKPDTSRDKSKDKSRDRNNQKFEDPSNISPAPGS